VTDLWVGSGIVFSGHEEQPYREPDGSRVSEAVRWLARTVGLESGDVDGRLREVQGRREEAMWDLTWQALWLKQGTGFHFHSVRTEKTHMTRNE
jgi:hypothetical protein